MFKKLNLFITLFSFLILFSQYQTDKEAMMEREMKSWTQKLLDYNVNPNTLNYNLKYQRLELDLDPAVSFVSGTVTSHFVPSQNINSIYFDLSSVLTVSSVTYRGNSVTFTQLSSDEVKIDFPSALSGNVLDSLSITYSGIPPAGNNAFKASLQNTVPVLYTLSEPYGAKDWFPTKQSLNDKIEKVALKITTPGQYSVGSNGKLISETVLSSGKKLTYWQTAYPIPAYLIALGITNYTKLTDTIGNPPIPYLNYLYPTTASNTAVIANINWTKQVMDLFEEYFGSYPYRNEKYGHMQFGFGGGMEHATMSSMGGFGTQVICHELAHQWFGDKVTCKTWNDIWLNEGFATFGEHLTYEKLLMSNADFMAYLQNRINNITSSPSGSVYVSEANLGNIGAIFSSRLSYAKGGYLLRMIKWILGDAAFYQAIKDYHSNPALAYGYASSTDFKNSLLTSTGKDFTEFFNDWLYGQGYPVYTVKWNQAVDKSMVFQVSQTQSDPSVSFFEMPLPIKVTGTAGETAYFTLDHTANNQLFTKPLDFEVSSVSFNYEYQLLTPNPTVTKDLTLATGETSAAKTVKLYPNPAKTEIRFSGIYTPQQYEILSIDGKMISKGTYTPGTGIHVSGLPKGVYLIILNSQQFKFIKE